MNGWYMRHVATGLDCRADGYIPVQNLVFEVKSGQGWMIRPEAVLGQILAPIIARQWLKFKEQIPTCMTVATLCNHNYRVYVANDDAEKGFIEKFPMTDILKWIKLPLI